MKKALTGNSIAFIPLHTLVSLGIPESEIRTGISLFLAGKTSNWKCVRDKESNCFNIQIDSLPKDLLPNTPLSNNCSKSEIKEDWALLNELESAISNFNTHLSKYNQYKYVDRLKFARKHSVLNVLWYYRYVEKTPLNVLFHHHQLLKLDYYTNQYSLSRILNQLNKAHREGVNFEIIISHKRKGKQAKNRRRITNEIENVIHYYHGQGMTSQHIADKVSKTFFKDESPIHKSTISTYLPKEIQSLYGIARYGNDWYKRNLEDYINRKKADGKFQVVESDGSRFQIPFYDIESDKVIYVSFYITLDVSSGKVLSGTIGMHENQEMVLQAFKFLIEKHKYAPSTIAMDMAHNKSSDFMSFREKLETKYSTIFLIHDPLSPNKKGSIETFFFKFHSNFCRHHRHYAGMGITARSDEHSLKKEVINRIYARRKELTPISEAAATLNKFINTYNNYESNQKSPNQIFAKQIVKNAKPAEGHDVAFIFWPYVVRKFHRGRIELDTLEYRVTDLKSKLKHRKADVKIFYNLDQPEQVYLFDLNDEFICSAERKGEITYDPKHLTAEERKEIFRVKKQKNKERETIIKTIAIKTDIALKTLSNYPEMEINTFQGKEVESIVYDQIVNKKLVEDDTSKISDAKKKIVQFTLPPNQSQLKSS